MRVPRRAHYVDNDASSARVVTGWGTASVAGLSVESIGRFLRFIRLFAISLKQGPFPLPPLPCFLFSLVA
jgi:hypothetical protein